MKLIGTLIDDFSVLSKEGLCENCSKQDLNKDACAEIAIQRISKSFYIQIW